MGIIAKHILSWANFFHISLSEPTHAFIGGMQSLQRGERCAAVATQRASELERERELGALASECEQRSMESR